MVEALPVEEQAAETGSVASRLTGSRSGANEESKVAIPAEQAEAIQKSLEEI